MELYVAIYLFNELARMDCLFVVTYVFVMGQPLSTLYARVPEEHMLKLSD